MKWKIRKFKENIKVTLSSLLGLGKIFAEFFPVIVEQGIQLIPIWIMLILDYIVGIDFSKLEYTLNMYIYLVVATYTEFFYYRHKGSRRVMYISFFNAFIAFITTTIYIAIFVIDYLEKTELVQVNRCYYLALMLMIICSFLSLVEKKLICEVKKS